MKKIILLLILPFVTLMAIDFTMTKEGLFTETTAQSPAPSPIADPTAETVSEATSTDLAPVKEEELPSDTTAQSPTPSPIVDSTSETVSEATSTDITALKEEELAADTAAQSPVSTPTTGVTPEKTSSYLEPIDLPKCDATKRDVQFIRKNADWKHINDKDKRIFCVSPGDYTSLKNIKLTTSGTDKKRRYIILNNGNNIHPGKLKKSQLANFALNLVGTSYWVIDRAASFDVNFTHSFILGKNSTNNIFNRLFTENLFHTMWIRNSANYNTIQNSRFNGVNKNGTGSDLATINVNPYSHTAEVVGTKVINNEFINYHAFRLNRQLNETANYDGTVFDSNTIEFNTKVRTDCNGNLNPKGECIAGEGVGVGIKSGSNNPSKPIIISNNKMWGYRPADPTYPNLNNTGSFITAYMGSKNVHIINNIMFDGTNGIIIADKYDKQRGTWNAVIKGNIIVNCGVRYRASNAFSITLSMAEGMNVHNNLIKDSRGKWGRVSWNMYNNFVGKNDIINPEGSLSTQDNWEPISKIDTNNIYNTATEAGYTEDFIFPADKFTNKPRDIKVEKVVKPN